MNLSFKPSHAGVSLWWAIAWRSLAVGIMLIVPMVTLVIMLQFPMRVALPLAYMVSPYLGVAVAVLFIIIYLLVQWFLVPVTVSAIVFRWLFRRGRIGSYALAGNYLGQPATTLRTALKYSTFFFLQNVKYVWPLFVGGALVGFTADTQGNLPPHVTQVILAFIPLGIYLYMLVLTDLIQRRHFSRLELILTKAAPAALSAPLDIHPESKPAPKAQAKAKPKPKAKAKK